MAIKINNSTTGVRVRIDYGSAISSAYSPFTMAGWFKRNTDTTGNEQAMGLYSAATSFDSGAFLGKVVAAGTWRSEPNAVDILSAASTPADATLDQWQYVAIVVIGQFTSGYAYWGTGSTLYQTTGIALASNTSRQHIVLGTYNDNSSDSFKGEIAHFRVWNAQLSQANLEAEMVSTTAVRGTGSGLLLDWGFVADATDGSGLGKNGTVSGTVTYTAGPTLGGGSSVMNIANFYNRLRAA